MDKEDCTQVLLSTLQQPLWKSCDSVTDWDLKNVLWKAGLLLTPEQVAALFADMKRRGFIAARDRLSGDRIVALWNVKITPAGEEWLAQRGHAVPRAPGAADSREAATPEGPGPEGGQDDPVESYPPPTPDTADLPGMSALPEHPENEDRGEDASSPTGASFS